VWIQLSPGEAGGIPPGEAGGIPPAKPGEFPPAKPGGSPSRIRFAQERLRIKNALMSASE